MKKLSCSVLLLFTFLFVTSINNLSTAQESAVSDSVTMGANYANEIYYSIESGFVLSSPRSTWDIAFRTKKFSSSILTNDGKSVILYTYPKSDTNGWASVDTSGFNTWRPMYNDPNDWENGAFSRNAKGYPDYGWAIYNDVTHDLVGDSLFVIQLRDGSLRKLWIKDKRSTLDIYHFRLANIDGTNDHTDTLDLSNDLATDFIGFSLETNQRVDFQPTLASWDILFTRYMSIQPDSTPYLVTGVLSNSNLKTKKCHPVPLSYTNWQANAWDSLRSSIGYDWKSYNTATSSYTVVDSLVYFTQKPNKNVHKLYFTGYAGIGSGKIFFTKEKLFSAGINNDLASSGLNITVYPNPVKETLHISVTGKTGDEIHFVLSDLSGRQLGADHPGRLAEGLNQFSFNVTGLTPGVYFVTASTAATKAVTKVIITR
ncbi:MAG: T9SS type A sorting domain-containing protein [Bacteroidota bacterium]